MKFTVTLRRSDAAKFDLMSHSDCEALNPKELLLYSAALCACYTLEQNLKRARLHLPEFEISLTGELSTPTLKAESYFTHFFVRYWVRTNDPSEQEAASTAVRKTHDEDCGLLKMLKMIAQVDSQMDMVS